MTAVLNPSPDTLLDERGLSKLIWRCRRGLLENDLFLARFFKDYQGRITVKQSLALLELMDLSDNDLLDLLLRRKEPDAELASLDVSSILSQIRHPQVLDPTT